jgi:hypothetical protein
MMTIMTLSSLWLLAKLQSLNNDDNDNNDNNDEDAVIASTSKNKNNHNVIFFVPVAVVVGVADKDGTRAHGCPPMLMLSRRRRGGDPLLLKPRGAHDDKDNDASIASASKNNKDQVRSSLGLRLAVELPA